MSDTKFRRVLRPDAQAFDEIRIVTVPRYKESEISGDEWRISAKVEFIRNGEVVYMENSSSVTNAVPRLTSYFDEAIKSSNEGFYGKGEKFCDQEGCSRLGVVTYALIYQYCTGPGGCGSIKYQGKEVWYPGGGIPIRRFCKEHIVRGDCGLEDADNNYLLITMDVPEGVEVHCHRHKDLGGKLEFEYTPEDIAQQLTELRLRRNMGDRERLLPVNVRDPVKK